MPSQVISAVFAMTALIVALVAGLAAGNPAAVTLPRAVGAMVVMYMVGGAIGMFTERIVVAHADRYRVRLMSGTGTSGELVENSVQKAESSPRNGQNGGH